MDRISKPLYLEQTFHYGWMKWSLPLLGALVFFPMLENGFSVLAGDDGWMVYNNDHVYSLSWNTLGSYFGNFYHGQYSPINTLAYGIIYHFFGMDPLAYHMFSFLLHLVNILLVYNFIVYLLSLSLRGVIDDSTKLRHHCIAYLTAVLFAIHPMQVESVAWVAASKIVFYSFFFLIALISYLRFIESGSVRYYFIAFAVFFISFGIKEQTVVFPLCLLLVDYYLKRDFTSFRLIREKIPFFLVSIGLGILEIAAQDMAFGYKLEFDYYPFWQRLVFASFSITEYLFKLIFPINLSYWYAFPMKPGDPLPLKLWLYPFVIGILAIYINRLIRKGKRDLVFGIGFFVCNIILTLHIIPMSRGVIMADRYVYLGSIGIFFILALLLIKIANSSRLRFSISLGLFVTYIVILGQYTFRYADRWT